MTLENREDMPLWDVAIEGMVVEDYNKKNLPLALSNFNDLAKEYDFRLDDIMETVFLMVMHGAWQYRAGSEDYRKLDRETLLEYCTKKRISDEELAAFGGVWLPME